jgi:hypothetical protein
MRKWISYLIMCILFFSINLFVTYSKEGNWDFFGSITVAALFLVFLLALDGITFIINKRKTQKE